MPKYEVDNFVVYEVGPDGTRRECAYIEDTGEVVPYDAASAKLSFPSPSAHGPKHKQASGRWKSTLIVFLLILCGGLGALLYRQIALNGEVRSNAQRQEQKLEMQIQQTQSHNSDLDRMLATERSKRAEMSKELEMARAKMPLIIQSIKVGNSYKGGDMETDFGLTIHASRTMYLKPQITYYGLTSGEETLTVKWIYPDGDVSQQSAKSYSIHAGQNTLNLVGWGNERMGHWRSGGYRVEIWRGSVCLGSASFTIWS